LDRALFPAGRLVVSKDGVGIAVGVGVADAVGSGVGDGRPKNSRTRPTTDGPPAHPANKINDRKKITHNRQVPGGEFRASSGAWDRGFCGGIRCDWNRNSTHRTFARFRLYYQLAAAEFYRAHREGQP